MNATRWRAGHPWLDTFDLVVNRTASQLTVGDCSFKVPSFVTVPSLAGCSLATSPGDRFVVETASAPTDQTFLSFHFVGDTDDRCEFLRLTDDDALWFQCANDIVHLFDPPPVHRREWFEGGWQWNDTSRILSVRAGNATAEIPIPAQWKQLYRAEIGPADGLFLHQVGNMSGADATEDRATRPGVPCGPLVRRSAPRGVVDLPSARYEIGLLETRVQLAIEALVWCAPISHATDSILVNVTH